MYKSNVFTILIQNDGTFEITTLGLVVRKPIAGNSGLAKTFVLTCFQLFVESLFCLFRFFKIDFFYCKVLQNISIEKNLGVEK